MGNESSYIVITMRVETVSLRIISFTSVGPYLLFHCAKLRVQGLEVVSEIALSVYSSLEVSQCHFSQPVRTRRQSQSTHLYTHAYIRPF